MKKKTRNIMALLLLTLSLTVPVLAVDIDGISGLDETLLKELSIDEISAISGIYATEKLIRRVSVSRNKGDYFLCGYIKGLFFVYKRSNI